MVLWCLCLNYELHFCDAFVIFCDNREMLESMSLSKFKISCNSAGETVSIKGKGCKAFSLELRCLSLSMSKNIKNPRSCIMLDTGACRQQARIEEGGKTQPGKLSVQNELARSQCHTKEKEMLALSRQMSN